MLPSILPYVRAHCIIDPWQLGAFIFVNALIALPYMLIPLRLLRIIRKAGGPPGVTRGTMRGAAIFIGSCGITHILGILTLFFLDLDWPVIAWSAWTAVISNWTYRRLAMAEPGLIRAIMDARQLEAKL